MKQGLRVLLLGDVVGPLGRAMVQKHLPHLKKDLHIDAVIANGENSADGKGITPRIARFFRHVGVDIITTGNHVWAKKEIYSYLAEHKDVLRPANFPSSCPGVGVTTIDVRGYVIGVVNVQGRVFMHQHVDCPFRAMESILTYLKSKTNCIFVDFHAETTSEKMGLAWFLDGKVSGVVGTHTHVQTADERILPQGTAFISDLGMAGSLNSMIGMRKEPIITAFITQMPQKFVVDIAGPGLLTGVWIEVDPISGKAMAIEHVKIIDNDISITTEHEEN